MKQIKSFFVLILVCTLAFSCKSDKKEAASDAVDNAVEATSDAVDKAAEATSDAVDKAAEATSDAVDNAVEATETAAPAEKQITVVFPKDTKLQNEVKEAIQEFLNSDPKMKHHFSKSYGFAVYPKITKGGLGIGGAGGTGLVFDNKTVIGESKLAQATFGLQAGGQQYREVIFFENKTALDKFTAGKVKFSGQASAVAIKDGASADINYQDGVAIVTKTMGGLMAEASVGGQSFKYKPGIN